MRDLIPEMPRPWFDDRPAVLPTRLDVDAQLIWQMRAKKYDDLLKQAVPRES